MRLLSILILLWVGSITTYGQKISDDLMEIQKVHNNDKQLSYKMKIIYGDRKTKSSIDSSFGEYSFYKNKYLISLEGIKSISNGSILVSVNDEMRSMIVSKAPTNIRKQVDLNFVDSVVLNSKIKSKVIFNKGATRTYSISAIGDGIDSVLISFNSEKFVLKKITVYYNRPVSDHYDYIPVVTYEYFDYSILEKEKVEMYSIQKYLNISKASVALTPKYKSYTLINHLKF